MIFPHHILLSIDRFCDRETQWNLAECIVWNPRHYDPLQLQTPFKNHLEQVQRRKRYYGPLHSDYNPKAVKRRRMFCATTILQWLFIPSYATTYFYALRRIFSRFWVVCLIYWLTAYILGAILLVWLECNLQKRLNVYLDRKLGVCVFFQCDDTRFVCLLFKCIERT